jgi:phosphoribosylaminoimidazole (AIR) synthetase
MGIGMLLVVPSGQASEAIRFLNSLGLPSWECGIVRKRNENEVGDSPAKGGSGGAVFLKSNYKI